MKKLMLFGTLCLTLLLGSCSNPAGPSQESGTFELYLFNATEAKNSTGEGYDFETGEKVRIDWAMSRDQQRMGTYGDLDGFPYAIWAKDRLQNNGTRLPIGENESVDGINLQTRSGKTYKINVRNEVTGQTRNGVASKYIVTSKCEPKHLSISSKDTESKYSSMVEFIAFTFRSFSSTAERFSTLHTMRIP